MDPWKFFPRDFLNLRMIDQLQLVLGGEEIISNMSSFASGSRGQYTGRELHQEPIN